MSLKRQARFTELFFQYLRKASKRFPQMIPSLLPMKYTLAITQQCNLACRYCYIEKNPLTMSLETAARIVGFMYRATPPRETMDIGFFGGEPLLELDLLGRIVDLVKKHDEFGSRKVLFSVVSNGTLFTEEAARKLERYGVSIGISCDGPPEIQDRSRVFPDGSGSSAQVSSSIQEALRFFPFMPVNAVYRPESLTALPKIIDYFADLGVRNLYLNPDITATWSDADALLLPEVYDRIGRRYIEFYRAGSPMHISLVDSKIVVLLRGGYEPAEKCRMGKGEFAFSPSGNIYPCERLIRSGDGGTHCLGNVHDDTPLSRRCSHDSERSGHEACASCSLFPYCMYWCGCTNFHATGDYHMPGPFLCASERAAISTAYGVLEELGKEGFAFSDHLAGTPLMSILGEIGALSAHRNAASE
ncbi:hypothetical protein BIU88_11755 [Chlorobaculum limnaeum]|uniref:Radical SAM core domain-containing protein n=1 Tax=Chlorobaculum limnaeum TaxID=274537 RepID=A0A1D8D2J8_CHLLM|nr:radical SAM protein [Chlorobaculum limnaeum]AOS84751.1 hypothetical protein BIU88_11755 [Chlorobaculum limnaeum]